MKGIYMAMASLLLAMLQGCDPEQGIYSIRENEKFTNGRFLRLNHNDSLFSDWRPDTPGRYPLNYENIRCREEKDLNNTKFLWEKEYEEKAIHFFFHRASGRVDTLYMCPTIGENYILSYVSGYKDYDKWILLEVKNPEDIVNLQDLCNSKSYFDKKDHVEMWDCTYKGQEKVFNSSIADYWIVNRYTTDFYGPFNMDEMKAQMRKLAIPLPMKLYGAYDRYVYTRTTYDYDGHWNKKKMPKHFYWPRHRSRKGTVIE